jgi:hypothetical protein
MASPLCVKFPVHSNVGLAMEERMSSNVDGFLNLKDEETPTLSSSYMIPSKTWNHPGHASDPRKMVAAVARARGLINRTTASTVSQKTETFDSKLSVPAHVARLASKWELVAYTLQPSDIAREIKTRGPLLAALRINDPLLHAVSSRLQGITPQVEDDDSSNHGTTIVAVLGWDKHESYTIALPWGKFASPSWDGTLVVDSSKLTNVCGIAKQEDVSPTQNNDTSHFIKVNVLPPSWDPLTMHPLPKVDHVGSVTGKQRFIRNTKKLKTQPPPPPIHPSNHSKPSVLQKLRSWMTEEHMNMTVQCSVTIVIIIVGILTLLLMRRRPVV